MIEIDPADRNLGLVEVRNVPGLSSFGSAPSVETTELKLTLPADHSMLDVLRALVRQQRTQTELAEEAVIERELDLANAERIAQGTRAKALRLRAELEAAEEQLKRFELVEGGPPKEPT